MSLNGALNIGGTALAINQAAIQTVGNNIANVGNDDYTRQTVNLGTTPDTQLAPGQFVGNGVQLDGIARQVDEALNARLRSTLSDNTSASTNQDWLGRVQSVFNELSDNDLSTQLSTFFNSWSSLANKPQDAGLRQVVIQNGQSLAKWFNQIGTQLGSLRSDLNTQVKSVATQADNLTTQIASLNGSIMAAESGGGAAQANGLRDQRDAAVKQLSQLMDIKTVQQDNGTMDVYVGSEPLVTGTTSNGVTTVTQVVGDRQETKLAFKSNNGVMKIASGQAGALNDVSDELDTTTDTVNQLASSLTFELNKVHASGQGMAGITSVIGTTTLQDSTVALTDPKSGLKQLPNNGSFVVHVKDKATGLSTTTLIKVDLDGKGTDTSLDSLISEINGVDGVTAVNNGGRLQISADNAPASEITFSQDSSGVLAALGVNTFFSGTDAQSIAVNDAVVKDPNLIAAAKNGDSGDNQTALAIADLATTAVKSLNGSTLNDSYQSLITNIATQTSQATADTQATAAVVSTLQNQRESISGVSMDEEAINLMRYQRAYQGAARLVTVVNDMMDTMMNMVH
ncbi:MAG: flagellar hook-associated protein FlgK [Tepidisphaeraceae bacterium]